MRVYVNGEEKEVRDGLTLEGLLGELQVRPGRVVVELNRCIIARETLGSTFLKNGDKLEIVHFVGGG